MFNYMSVAYRGDKLVHSEEKTLSGEDLAFHGAAISRLGFLELINRWNRNGLLGIANGGPIYIYTVLP